MTKPAILLLALLGLALLGRLDRDGLLAHTGAAARALGFEIRVEVTVRRSGTPLPACPEEYQREAGAGSTLPCE